MHILIVDDSADCRRFIAHFLRQGGFNEISEAASTEQTYQHIGLSHSTAWLRYPVDMILMEVSLPGIGGIDACRRIKRDIRFRDVPVLMITGNRDIDLLDQAFKVGASDYINKPFHPVELLARVNYQAKLKQEVEQRKARERDFENAKQELQKANKELARISCLDGLTGISNRRHFDAVMQREWDRAKRSHRVLSLALVDVDYFKNFNDEYGHQRGDQCLASVALALREATKRSSELVARYGGEEFAVILPEVDKDHAVNMAKLLNKAVSELKIEHKASNISEFVTASVGVSTSVPTTGQGVRQLISQADMALYRSKAAGRDRVTHVQDTVGDSDFDSLKPAKPAVDPGYFAKAAFI